MRLRRVNFSLLQILIQIRQVLLKALPVQTAPFQLRHRIFKNRAHIIPVQLWYFDVVGPAL